MKKYEFTDEIKIIAGISLRRIRAVADFSDVKAGTIGGFLEKESNLSHDGDAWVAGNALVTGNARVAGNAWVAENAWVAGNAWVTGNAHYLVVSPIGSRDDTLTFARSKSETIYAKVGCFFGSISKFREKVQETHGESKHAKAYLLAADLAEIRIDTTPIED